MAPPHQHAASAEPKQDIAIIARSIIKKKFHFLDLADECTSALFSLAVEEQARKFLNNLEALPRGQDSSSTRAYDLQKPAPTPKEQLLASGLKIGTLPIIFHKMMETINNPYASTGDIAAIISTDTALSARLLRLVNSPFYSLPTRVDTISRAVSLVGHGPLIMLTMGTILATAFKGIPTSIVDMRKFWLHAFSTGVTAKILAERTKQENPEQLFVAGLLHDIARLLILMEAPASALYMLTESRQSSRPLYELENEILGITHADLGVELLESWHCSEVLVDLIKKHHAPLDEQTSLKETILPVANCLALALGYGSSGDFFLPRVPTSAWAILGITPQTIPTIAKEMHDFIKEMSFVIEEQL